MPNLFLDLLYWFNWIALAFFVTLNLFYGILFIAAWFSIHRYNREHNLVTGTQLAPELTKPFSLLVPAYNESTVIVECVSSFTRLDFPEYEVIVCNDGSTDSTLEKLIAAFALEKVHYDYVPHYPSKPIKAVYFSRTNPRLVVIDKENGGKADAQNAAANCARYPYVGAVDSDSLLSADSMRKLMLRFSAAPSTVGAGGIVRVSNGCLLRNGEVAEIKLPRRMIERIQVVEYLRAFLFGRMGWSSMNVLLIISGAFGIFRQDLLALVHGWNQKSIGEDMELVTKLHRHIRKNKLPYTLSFAPDPVCWTQVPSNLSGLSKQRDRWQRGLMQTLFWNIDMLFNPRYGRIGMIGIPYFFIFEMLGCVIEVLAFPVIIACLLLGIVNIPFFWFFLSISLIWGLCLTYASLLLEEISFSRYRKMGDLFGLFVAGFLENFGFRQLHAYWRFKGLIKYVFRIKSGWGTIKRTAINAK